MDHPVGGTQRALPRLYDTYDTRTTTYKSAYSTAVQLRQPITGGHSRQLHLRQLLRVGGTGTEVRCHIDIPHRNDDVVRNAGLQEEEEEEEEEETEEEEALKPTLAHSIYGCTHSFTQPTYSSRPE